MPMYAGSTLISLNQNRSWWLIIQITKQWQYGCCTSTTWSPIFWWWRDNVYYYPGMWNSTLDLSIKVGHLGYAKIPWITNPVWLWAESGWVLHWVIFIANTLNNVCPYMVHRLIHYDISITLLGSIILHNTQHNMRVKLHQQWISCFDNITTLP